MEHERRQGHHFMNGMTRPVDKKKEHNYKLVVDPFLHKGHPQKVYRFDGVVPGENRVVSTRDPRPRLTRLWTRQQQADLPVPKFKYDEYYVGVPPPKDVTFTNLNDNINKDFLENMCKGCGKIEECKIYYHPRTRKHLGIGKTLFTSSKAAKACVDKFNNTSKMGNIINVFIDTMGKERNRLIEELTCEQSRRPPQEPQRAASPGQRNSGRLSDSSYADMEAYDPGDMFDTGHPEQEYTPSIETDYSGYSEGAYSAPQSEMSFSSQDTGYSSANSAMGMGFHGDGYNHYTPRDLPPPHHPHPHNTSHPPPGNNYYHGHHYSGNHQHPRHTPQPPPHHQHHRHHGGHIVHHHPPATPAHRHTPQATPHYPMMGQDMDTSHYGFYAPPPPVPKPPFDQPPPPLPPEPQPPPPDRSFHDHHHHGSDRSRFSHNQHRKKRSREPKPPPPRLPSPEPNSDEPRMESLESRIQSLLQNQGMASPDHTGSSSSQDEATPSHNTARESPFDFQPPPAAESLPPLPELTKEDLDIDTRDTPGQVDSITQGSGVEESSTGEQFESQPLDSQTVIEETVNTESGATRTPTPTPTPTPTCEGLQNGERDGSEVAPTAPPEAPQEKKGEKGAEDEDDRMSLSSISSGEEKLEINPPLPPTSSIPSTSTPSFTSPPPALPASSTSTTPPSWHLYPHLMGSPPLGSLPPSTYQNGMFGVPTLSPGRFLTTQEEKEDPNDKTFTTVLDKFVKELKTIMQKDLCKKMVENSAFKAFETWWDCEVLKSKKSQMAEKEPEAVQSTSAVTTKTKTSSDIKPEMSASLASLFESRDRGGLDNSGMGYGGYGGFLGIRGGMPKLPSFKRKFHHPSVAAEEDEDSRKLDAKSLDDEESDEESAGSKQKPLISESEEESDSSDEEKEELSADEEDEDEDGSEESSEEESEDSSEEEEEEEESEMEEEGPEAPAKPQAATVGQEESRVEEKMEVEKSDDEDEDVDVGTEADVSHLSASDAETSHHEEDSEHPMDIDEEPSPKGSSVKDSPEKRPLSPILEEKEAEEQAATCTTAEGDKSDLAQTSTTSSSTESSSTMSAESSAMDSDSSAVEPTTTKVSLVSKGKGKGHKSLPTIPEKETAPADKGDVSESMLTEDETVCVTEEIHESESSQKQSESEAEQRSSFMVPAIAEHDYFSFPPVSKEETTADSDQTESADEDSESLSVLGDHNYSLPPIVNQVRIGKAVLKKEAVITPKRAKEPKKRPRTKKSKNNMLADITNRPEEKVSRELAGLLTPVKPLPKLKCRTFQEERQIFFDIYDRGISEEDVKYLKRSYDELIQSDDPNFYWLNDILWVDHTHTDIPDVLPTIPKKRKKSQEDHTPKLHKTGCARSEGYYKLTMMEKAGYLRHAHIQQKAADEMKKIQDSKKAQTSREARHHNRRLQTTYSDLETDLLRFNQLKFRKKQLKFAKSGIHDWGLFALEPIASEEMVIEYVGQVVRQSIADEREKRYEAIGIGSSYLFRVDTETIIDATKTGNLARFINHSCNPNCYAKIITVESEKKIVIYSKRDIDVNEEITYDYKFPLEDEKIPCLCGAPGCRGTLN